MWQRVLNARQRCLHLIPPSIAIRLWRLSLGAKWLNFSLWGAQSGSGAQDGLREQERQWGGRKEARTGVWPGAEEAWLKKGWEEKSRGRTDGSFGGKVSQFLETDLMLGSNREGSKIFKTTQVLKFWNWGKRGRGLAFDVQQAVGSVIWNSGEGLGQERESPEYS